MFKMGEGNISIKDWEKHMQIQKLAKDGKRSTLNEWRLLFLLYISIGSMCWIVLACLSKYILTQLLWYINKIKGLKMQIPVLK